MSQAVTHFQTEAARLGHGLPGAGNAGLDALRAAALARFVREGLPVTRQEDWKYTSLVAVERKPLPVLAAEQAASPTLAEVLRHAVLPKEVNRLVFVDGHFAPGLSSHRLPAGVRAGSLAARLDAQPQEGLPFATSALIAPAGSGAAAIAAQAAPAAVGAAHGAATPAVAAAHAIGLGTGLAPTASTLHGITAGVPAQGSSLAALNVALGADGLDLDVPAGVVIEDPIMVLFVSATPDTSALPVSSIRLGDGSRATVIEQHFSLHEGAALNSVFERIEVGAKADLHHIKVQHEGPRAQHVADTEAIVHGEGQLHSMVLALGGALAREDLRVTLAQTGAHVDLDGLYLANGRQHLDHHTTVHHASPACTSAQAYRGILDDAGRGVFNGRVIVAKDAQHTDAQQNNANLLLSENAEIDTKPQLEIFADDVKCSHGATIGQLDPAQLFYLRSRGLDETAARSLVTFAFAAHTLHRIDSSTPLFSALRTLLFARLPGGAALIEDITA